MKVIAQKKIRLAVAQACKKAAFCLRPDVLAALEKAARSEPAGKSKKILQAIIENARIARRRSLAICQDTGMPVVFIELGSSLRLAGDLKSAVNQGITEGYRQGFLRESIVKDPLGRGASGFAPTVIHLDLVKGSRMKITVLPKGFGCENKSQLKMFNPTAGPGQVMDFIVSAVKNAGPDACPPYVVGVGIGGTADYASLLAKKALLRPVARPSANKEIARFEAVLLKRINALPIGPMGLGGKTTALAAHLEAYPTHIAGLPVAVNISCHALRSATVVL